MSLTVVSGCVCVCCIFLADLESSLPFLGFPEGSNGKESACNAGDPGLIPVLGRFPGEGNGSPLQYFCLENPMGRGPWHLQSIGSQRVRHD